LHDPTDGYQEAVVENQDMSALVNGDQAGAASAAQALAVRVRQFVAAVIVGKDSQVELLLIALLSEGHVLLDDVPGVAKTLLVRTLAAALGLSYARVQCTPDLLPADITGSLVFNQKTADFEFRPGPVFANLVLADEINRATPRTQSSFLEAMQERQITVEGQTHQLPRPFLVLATQNPVEQKGTFPLPEAQLDRFLMRLQMGYPSAAEEKSILTRFEHSDTVAAGEPVVSGDEIAQATAQAHAVHVSSDVADYIVALVRATREHEALALGASPRAALMLMRAAQGAAALAGRTYVIPDDVVRLAQPVLAHRLLLSREAQMARRSSEEVIAQVVAAVAVPVEDPPDERH
jgi:MoxR-like ATPase